MTRPEVGIWDTQLVRMLFSLKLDDEQALLTTRICYRLGSKRSDLTRHLSLLLLMMFLSEEVGRFATKAGRASSCKRGYNMETLLIILLVLFLVGGGGWGYSRWRS